jgi:DNA-binding SARP family transcriptional activator
MLALAHSGERAEALRLYQRFRVLLKDELDAVPEPETVAVYERLQQGATP